MFKILVATVLLFGFSSLAAHGSHEHNYEKKQENMSEQKVKQKATVYLGILLDDNKVAKSWKTSTIINSEKKTFGTKEEWVISFANTRIKDTEKQILYIFLSLQGKPTGANYSGI